MTKELSDQVKDWIDIKRLIVRMRHQMPQDRIKTERNIFYPMIKKYNEKYQEPFNVTKRPESDDPYFNNVP